MSLDYIAGPPLVADLLQRGVEPGGVEVGDLDSYEFFMCV